MLHSCVNLLTLLKLNRFKLFLGGELIFQQQLANSFDGVALLANLLNAVSSTVRCPRVRHGMAMIPGVQSRNLRSTKDVVQEQHEAVKDEKERARAESDSRVSSMPDTCKRCEFLFNVHPRTHGLLTRR